MCWWNGCSCNPAAQVVRTWVWPQIKGGTNSAKTKKKLRKFKIYEYVKRNNYFLIGCLSSRIGLSLSDHQIFLPVCNFYSCDPYICGNYHKLLNDFIILNGLNRAGPRSRFRTFFKQKWKLFSKLSRSQLSSILGWSWIK